MENNESNQAVTPAKQPAQDLLDKVKATKAIVTAHSLLGVGMFQARNHDAVQQSIEFLGALHKQILSECLEHPDADLIQDLVDYREAVKKQEEFNKLVAEQAQSNQE